MPNFYEWKSKIGLGRTYYCVSGTNLVRHFNVKAILVHTNQYGWYDWLTLESDIKLAGYPALMNDRIPIPVKPDIRHSFLTHTYWSIFKSGISKDGYKIKQFYIYEFLISYWLSKIYDIKSSIRPDIRYKKGRISEPSLLRRYHITRNIPRSLLSKQSHTSGSQ